MAGEMIDRIGDLTLPADPVPTSREGAAAYLHGLKERLLAVRDYDGASAVVAVLQLLKREQNR